MSIPPASAPGSAAVTARLAAMMFLQFFLWGAWFVTLGPFMNERKQEPTTIGYAYTTASVGAILAPIFLGMIADRFFATQRVLGVLHLLGGVCLLAAPTFAPKGAGDDAVPFIAVLLAHMLCYMPTLGLTSSLAFHHMTNPEKQFPPVRVLGTIGWIVAGFAVAFVTRMMTPQDSNEAARASAPYFFYVAGASGILLGLYAFSLPHTPPPARGKPFNLGSAMGFDALSMLKDRNFAIFCVCSFLLCIPLAAYYAFAANYAKGTGITDVPVKMTFGQMSEIVFMLVMPLFFAKLGVKWMLGVGMLAWAARYLLFGAAWGGHDGQEHVKWMVLAGIILHGICYDFFFVTGMIYVEKKCLPTVRAQAQCLLVLLTQGLGMLVGNQVFPRIVEAYTTSSGETGVIDWRTIWFIPAGFAAAIFVFFAATFNERRAAQPTG
ncbi:MAG: MFS transporter [Phycisphaerales bacterium]